ncbi:MAG TPA: DUF4278 domain-containing protein [Crinalium sp.]
MQLIYRGHAYAYTATPAMTSTEDDIIGKYRGAMLKRSSCNGIFIHPTPATLTYRGTPYTMPQ